MASSEQEIINLVAGILAVPAESLSLQTGVGDLPEWDSLAQVAIVTTVEEEYQLNLDPDSLMDIATIADLVALVAQQSAEPSASSQAPALPMAFPATQESIVSSICRMAENQPASTALIIGNEAVTYRQLVDSIASVAAWYCSQGVKCGDYIALGAVKCKEFIVCYFAAHALGATVVNLDPEINADRLKYILGVTNPVLLVGVNDETSLPFSAVDTDAVAELPELPAPDTIADLMFTTGTTAVPKGVPLTHANLAAAAAQINRFIGSNAADVEVVALPICHSFGMGRIRCVLSIGGTVVLVPGFSNVKLLFRTLKAYKATGFAFVPAAWAYIQHMSADKLAECASTLRYIEIGSAPMSVESRRHLMRLFPSTRICMHYGLTEASRSSFIEFHREPSHLASAGKASPGVEIRIYSSSGELLPPESEGEICVKGPHVMAAYFNAQMDEDSRFDGFFRTGDWGKLDKDGYLYVLSRTKDIINCGGKKISPEEVESVILTIPGVAECACIAMPDPQGLLGEVVKAILVSDDSPRPDDKTLHSVVASKLEAYKCPVAYEWRTSLPRTASGKLQRRMIN
ncbi:MAG: AMP-binding protein [Akkermansia sp.]|nr:AMP-binding protein [Akkermansia sp.]